MQRRRPKLDFRAGSQLGLLDGVEEHDLLVCDVGLQAPDSLDRNRGRWPGGNDAVTFDGLPTRWPSRAADRRRKRSATAWSALRRPILPAYQSVHRSRIVPS